MVRETRIPHGDSITVDDDLRSWIGRFLQCGPAIESQREREREMEVGESAKMAWEEPGGTRNRRWLDETREGR